MLLIIDNQSTFIQRFKKNYLVYQDFPYMFIDHNQPLILPPNTQLNGIILTGGKGNPYKPLNLTTNFVAIMNFNVPIIGFCLGHEILAVAYNSRLKKHGQKQDKKEKIVITRKDDPIFEGIEDKEIWLQESHTYHISQLSDAFEVLGYSDTCQYEIIKHKERPLYGFQSHPEVSGKKGVQIVENFLKICGLI